jgi:hypothetical protein
LKNAKNTLRNLEVRLKRKLRKHLQALGLDGSDAASGNGTLLEKEVIRLRHYFHREELLDGSRSFVSERLPALLQYFGSGNEVLPEKIKPRIEVVSSGTWQAELFRLASLTWSVPVSEGYGRRMRFVVWDDNNGKLIGLIALGDPVFNLHVRDQLIGWNADDRKARLVNVMDAYVLGALPPYNMLLGGKLVASLVRTKDVRDVFSRRYSRSTGIISGEAKRPKLVLVTTTSALGRSSVYNRLRLAGQHYFESIGYTSGFGHFHVPNPIFQEMRDYLRLRKHSYCDENCFGNGLNWKFRTIRAALELMGVKRDLLQHGIKREVFVSYLARNSVEFLRGETKHVDYGGLLSVSEVGALAGERWLCPRARRRPEFSSWRREDIINLIKVDSCERLSPTG